MYRLIHCKWYATKLSMMIVITVILLFIILRLNVHSLPMANHHSIDRDNNGDKVLDDEDDDQRSGKYKTDHHHLINIFGILSSAGRQMENTFFLL